MRPLALQLPVATNAARNTVTYAAFVLLGICCGTIVVALTPSLGVKLVPGLLFVCVFLPWLCRDPFRILLWLIITWPLIWPARLELPAGIPDIAYERIFLLLLLGLVVLPAIACHQRLQSLGLFPWLFLGSQAVLLVRSLWFGGPVRPEFGNVINFVVLPVTAYWMAKHVLVSRQRVEWLLGSIIVAAALLCCTGIYERVLDAEQSPYPVTPHNEAGDTRYLDVPGGRAAGTLGNPAQFGVIMGFGLMCSLCLFAHASTTRSRWLFFASTAFLVYGTFISYTRSAWASVFLALFVVQFLIKDIWKKTLPILLGGTLLVGLAWVALSDSSAVQKRLTEKDNAFGRVDRILWCWDQFLEKPVLGWGLEATNYLMPSAFPADGFSTSHNTLFSLMMDGGVVLTLGFLGVLSYWLVNVRRVVLSQPKDSFDRSVSAAMVGCVLIWGLSGMAVELRYFGYFNTLLWITGAVIEVMATNHQANRMTPATSAARNL